MLNPIGGILLLIAVLGAAAFASEMPNPIAAGNATETSDADLALGRPATASSSFHGVRAGDGNDGEVNTLWGTHVDGDGDPAPPDTQGWWQVDLGKRVLLGRLELVARQKGDQPFARQNIEFRGSNDPKFVGYTVVAAVGDTPFGPAGAAWKTTVPPGNSFRYVRIVKKDASHFNFAEFRLFAAPVPEAP